ncbi:glucose-1-phosphate adenylyltransferase [Sinobaca qinghaiensis]|uniref:Glucose-1-phosphate adenylyltransferase n=1 Tax=Sinobaca qinghaiensis TaxID=342944 RepID=A0A419V3T7_9BACL|nr:glucose-1-phosphate adenylyltransferase subunit GlgD [Sinobaca qinghaiensis]RKD73179.1 glucose-1-phosphate adenylyltransferase [Sinobaca qinghaiensis]
MAKMMGVINLDSEYSNLNELTYFRSGAAVPFAGRYRLIDFTLSNMSNANIHDIAIFAREKYRSLMDHLGTGSDWDLDRKRGGLFILPPDWNDPSDISRGDLQHFHNNRDFFERSSAEYVFLSGSQCIMNLPISEALDKHISSDADVTLISASLSDEDREDNSYLKLQTDENGAVTAFSHDRSLPSIFTGMYIIKKSLLMELVDECINNEKENFFLNGIKDNLHKLSVQTYHHEGYTAFIQSLKSYYKQNMRLLNTDHYQTLFFENQRIYTKVKDEPPTKYGDSAEVNHSLVANGCTIEGEVSNSILFRGVTVEKGAVVKDSIILQRCHIKADSTIDYSIIDKDSTIASGTTLKGIEDRPYVIAKRSVI